MQLHINHVDPAEAARMLTYVEINAALREITQQLYGVVAARNIAISAQLPCGTAIYTTANNVAKHPQTAWDAACRAHVDWIRAHAGELGARLVPTRWLPPRPRRGRRRPGAAALPRR